MNFTKGQQENDNENFKAVDSITQNSVYNGGFNYRAICHFQSVLEQIFGAVVRRSGKYRNASLFDNWHIDCSDTHSKRVFINVSILVYL